MLCCVQCGFSLRADYETAYNAQQNYLYILWNILYIDGLEQDCSNFGALAIELLQFRSQPSVCVFSKYYL